MVACRQPQNLSLGLLEQLSLSFKLADIKILTLTEGSLSSSVLGSTLSRVPSLLCTSRAAGGQSRFSVRSMTTIGCHCQRGCVSAACDGRGDRITWAPLMVNGGIEIGTPKTRRVMQVDTTASATADTPAAGDAVAKTTASGRSCGCAATDAAREMSIGTAVVERMQSMEVLYARQRVGP